MCFYHEYDWTAERHDETWSTGAARKCFKLHTMNDRATTTHADVLRWFDRAIELANAEVSSCQE
jgi:hypothetical protein